jgi:hypothetical protein
MDIAGEYHVRGAYTASGRYDSLADTRRIE